MTNWQEGTEKLRTEHSPAKFYQKKTQKNYPEKNRPSSSEKPTTNSPNSVQNIELLIREKFRL